MTKSGALSIVLTPSAHIAANSMAIPARMSGPSSRAARNRDGPETIARCGSLPMAPLMIRWFDILGPVLVGGDPEGHLGRQLAACFLFEAECAAGLQWLLR